MKQMYEVKVKILLVFSGEHIDGLITIGDIQRAIIKNIVLKEPVSLLTYGSGATSSRRQNWLRERRIVENAWKDMGEWPEFLKMIDVL